MKKFFLLLMALSLTGCAVRSVEDGQKGVQADFGKIHEEPLGTGWHWYNPMITWIEIWNVKTQNLEETCNVPSSEGLVSNLDVSILFHIPAEKVVIVRKTIGSDYTATVLEPYMREAIRNVASGYPVSDLYSETGRNQIAKMILQYLTSKLDNRGIVVEDVLIRGVQLPGIFSASIENKLKTAQESLQKQYELQKAKMDAQIEIAKAEGVARSNKIIADSITDNYLRYKFIDTLSGSEKQIIYVPTEANLPILEAGRTKPAKQ